MSLLWGEGGGVLNTNVFNKRDYWRFLYLVLFYLFKPLPNTFHTPQYSALDLRRRLRSYSYPMTGVTPIEWELTEDALRLVIFSPTRYIVFHPIDCVDLVRPYEGRVVFTDDIDCASCKGRSHTHSTLLSHYFILDFVCFVVINLSQQS